MTKEKGWKPIPLPLKIIVVVLILWMIGAVMNLSNLSENGMPLFGNIVYGMNAAMLPILVDIIGPLTFLYALWTRKSWAPYWAYGYMGIFILNSVVALFTLVDEFGLPQILAPAIASLVILAVIFWQRIYFNRIPNR